MNEKKFEIVAALVMLAMLLGSIIAWHNGGLNFGGTPAGKMVARVSTSTSVLVGTSQTQLLPANGNRNGVVFTLPFNSSGTVAVTCGTNATSGQAIELSSTTPRYESPSTVTLACAWNGLGTAAGLSVGIFEW